MAAFCLTSLLLPGGGEGKPLSDEASLVPTPGAPEQIKLSLGGPGEIVVSWVSHDAIPTDGSCFKPNVPRLDKTGAGTAGSPFPYPISRTCHLAVSEVAFWIGPSSYQAWAPHSFKRSG